MKSDPITEQIARLREQRDQLAKEEEALVFAQQVLARHGFTITPAGSVGADSVATTKDGRLRIPRKGSKRPPGIPTTRQMVNTVLADAEVIGADTGVTGRQLLESIHQRWWPGVGWTQILPEVSRLIKDKGEVEKVEGRFRRTKKPKLPLA